MFLLLQGLKFVNPSGCFYIDNRSVVGGHFIGHS